MVARSSPVGWIFCGGGKEESVTPSVIHLAVRDESKLSDFGTTDMGVCVDRSSESRKFDDAEYTECSSCELVERQRVVSYPRIKDLNLLPDNKSQ